MSSHAPQNVAQSLLERIPPAERALALRDIAKSLHSHRDDATAGLLAGMLEAQPDEDATQHLRDFLTSSIHGGYASSAASVCANSSTTRDWLLATTCAALQQTAFDLLERNEKNMFVATRDQVLPLLEVVGVNGPRSGDFQSMDSRTAVEHLNFILHFFRLQAHSQHSTHVQSASQAILPFLLAVDLTVVSVARDAVIAIFGSIARAEAKTITSMSPSDRLSRKVILCLRLLQAPGTGKLYKSIACQIWLRCLHLSLSVEILHTLFDADEYWTSIQTALISGDFEQRKACLHIARQSLALALEHKIDINCTHMSFVGTIADKRKVQQSYERYFTVYETIIMGRYMNQVRECARDLDHLASSSSSIDESWLYVLLMPALSSTTQDGIQKFAGTWLMRSYLKPHAQSGTLITLLVGYFLPWVTEGPLFTSSLTGPMDEKLCEHGDLLASFITRLLLAYSSTGHETVRADLTCAILGYIHRHKNNIISHAVVYVLQGVLDGLRLAHDSTISTTEVEYLLDLAAVTGYPEIVRDTVLVQALGLTQLTSIVSNSIIDSKKVDLKSRVNNLQRKQLDDGHRNPRWTSLNSLEEDLETTKCSCLQGEGLLAACQSLPSLLSEPNAGDYGADALLTILDAIWTEVEIQDYPKLPLRLLPSICFHPKLVKKALTEEALMDCVSTIFEHYRRLIQSRIYLWTPLIKSLKSALNHEPHLAEHIPVTEFVIEVANKPPAPRLEFQLDAAVSRVLSQRYTDFQGLTYRHYNGEHSSIGYAIFFGLLTDLGAVSVNLVDELYDHLLMPWVSQKLPPPVVNKWKTTEQLQIVLILLEQRLARDSLELASQDLALILRLLAVEPLPRFRFLLEWMISRIIHKHQNLREGILSSMLTKDHHSNPKYLASMIKLSTTIACMDECDEDFAVNVTAGLVALASSSKSGIRHEAQWRVPIMWSHAESRGWEQITTNPSSRQLIEYIQSLNIFATPPLERQLEKLDPVKDFTLTNLLSGSYLHLEPPGVERVGWHDLQKLDGELSPSNRIPIGGQLPSLPTRPALASTKTSQQDTHELTALQTKGTAYLSSTIEDSTSSRPTPLIVVGSLVDAPFNLGGLSRVSEILGAASLYLANPTKILADKQFLSVAVASQSHIPIFGLTPTDLPNWLTEKKNEGYCIVGIEQTDRSKILGDDETRLPEKTVLVLGAEKEGMPAHIMGECDLLVEIPQKGKTRSMNVQTAAATVMYEYSRQHRRV